jgi:hypothetical protein
MFLIWNEQTYESDLRQDTVSWLYFNPKLTKNFTTKDITMSVTRNISDVL